MYPFSVGKLSNLHSGIHIMSEKNNIWIKIICWNQRAPTTLHYQKFVLLAKVFVCLYAGWNFGTIWKYNTSNAKISTDLNVYINSWSGHSILSEGLKLHQCSVILVLMWAGCLLTIVGIVIIVLSLFFCYFVVLLSFTLLVWNCSSIVCYLS